SFHQPVGGHFWHQVGQLVVQPDLALVDELEESLALTTDIEYWPGLLGSTVTGVPRVRARIGVSAGEVTTMVGVAVAAAVPGEPSQASAHRPAAIANAARRLVIGMTAPR
ncbi:hypothetical protein AB0K48_37715, partial [Nonomuraea sp. NPDC055795]